MSTPPNELATLTAQIQELQNRLAAQEAATPKPGPKAIPVSDAVLRFLLSIHVAPVYQGLQNAILTQEGLDRCVMCGTPAKYSFDENGKSNEVCPVCGHASFATGRS